jgi:hypothetical protein
MSRYFEYKNHIIKISNQILNNFEIYSIKQKEFAYIQLCKYIYNFNKKYKKKIIKTQFEWQNYNNIIDFNKYDKQFKYDLINKVIIDINNLNTKYNNYGLFNKLYDILEEE